MISNNTYLELVLNNRAMQDRIRDFRRRSLLNPLRVIERAAADKRVTGMILNLAGFDAGREELWELRSAVREFKSRGKKVCAFISTANLDLYCLASIADKIVMDEQGTLSLSGYVWGRAYARHTLEKFGIGVRELRYLKYKSAAEMFTRDSISEADRVQYGAWLDDVFAVTKDTLLKARSWTGEEFDAIVNNEFLYSAKSARARGLVDRVGRREAVAETVKEIAGSEKNSFVCYGEKDSGLMESKSEYGPGRAGGFFRRAPVVAVVYASGQADMERGMSARSLVGTIRNIAGQKRVKAIVMRIDSPGGSAEAADYIAEAVKYARKKMPVVVSMGAVAASGGYWAAMDANEIIASPYTLTGSIGVIGSWFYDSGLNSKLGVTVDSLQRGDHADLGSGFVLPRRDLNPAEEERYRNLLMDMYDDFVTKVAAGRSMDIEKAEAAAQGRVYSGLGALNAGLIDRIGGLADAIRSARNLADIPESVKLKYSEYPRPKFADRLLGHLPLSRVFGFEVNGLPGSLLNEPLADDLRYRISRNGQVMPIVPLDCAPGDSGLKLAR